MVGPVVGRFREVLLCSFSDCICCQYTALHKSTSEQSSMSPLKSIEACAQLPYCHSFVGLRRRLQPRRGSQEEARRHHPSRGAVYRDSSTER